MEKSSRALNRNNSNSVNTNNTNDSRTIYDTATTVNILKALFERENYAFSSFSSKDHPEIIRKTIEKSQQEDVKTSVQLNGDPVLNEFVNYFYTTFSNFLSTRDICKTTIAGMIKYEIYSIQSLNTFSSMATDHKTESIWLPKSMTTSAAHRIFSTLLYSSNRDTIPVDLADYVLVYENIIISLENQSKELYEEILKISFRLNRVVSSPFRLWIIHKSQLLLLERRETKPLLTDNQSISVLQLILFHLITNNTYQPENESEYSIKACSANNKDQDHQYWPISESKIGIIPSSHLTHPLKHNKLSQLIGKIMQHDKFSTGATTSMTEYFKILVKIFISVNADISYINLILSSLSKLIQVYDYPLLVALPYDRLLLSQFCKTRCSDGRWAQGIMVNGKYYSLSTYPYTPMSELKVNRGSLIHLRFNFQSDTVIHGNVSSCQTNEFEIISGSEEVPDVNKNKFISTKYQYSAKCDNNTVRLMFPSPAIDTIITTQQLEQKSDLQTKTADQNKIEMNHLKSQLKSFNNWIKVPINTDGSKKQTDKSNTTTTDHAQPSPYNASNHHVSTKNQNLNQAMETTFSSATLINKASTFSLPPIDKPECLNCLSHLNDNNLECPHCTQVFCQLCIESSYDDVTNDRCCPKCYKPVQLSAYRKSPIIGKFEKEGISAFKCLNCNSIAEQHRLCLDPTCSALFCIDCCKKANGNQPTTSETFNSLKQMKCSQCEKADTYVSGAVTYYVVRIVECRAAQELESKSSVSSSGQSFPNTIWQQEEFLPEKGTLEENRNRIISVIQFNGNHIQFGNKEEHCPLLVINEPPEYICPESLQLSYWNTDNEINRWENDKNVQFHQYNRSSIATYIQHFSAFTVRNTRFTENIELDKAFLDSKFDYDFTTKDDTGKTFQRGTEPYKRPCGWYRKAIRVVGKFGDETWLATGSDAWPVAYHGTATANALSILRNGLLVGGSNGTDIAHGDAYGRGIYLSPNPLFSSRTSYAAPLTVGGRQYQIMFQVRVKTDSIKKHTPDIWKCINSQEVRPYGILFRET